MEPQDRRHLCRHDRISRLIAKGLYQVYRHGDRVLVDQSGVAEILQAAPGSESPPPVEPEQVQQNQREFWIEATQVPICISRGGVRPAHSR